MTIPKISFLISFVLMMILGSLRIFYHLEVDPWLSSWVDQWIWIPVIQLVAIAFLVWRIRRENWKWQYAIAFVPPLIVFVSTGLLFFGDFDSVAIWVVEFLVCGLLPAAWVALILGFILLIYDFTRKGKRSRRLSRFRALRFCLPALLFLGTMEIAASLIPVDEPITTEVLLPENYPDLNTSDFHLAAIGASSMVGFPYQPKVGIPQFLADLLRAELPEKVITETNLAEPGINLRRAIERMRELSSKPDVLLVYSGHNEFFYDVPRKRQQRRFPRRLFDPLMSWSRAYRLLASLVPQPNIPRRWRSRKASILHDALFTNEAIEQRVAQYRRDLEALVRHCEDQDISVLLFLPAHNEGVFAPSRSSCERALSDSEEAELNRRYHQCVEMIDSAEYERARLELSELLKSYPGVAHVEFQLGVCLAKLGETNSAREYFQSAAEHDLQPPHITEAYRQAIRSVASQYQVEMIDASQILRKASPTGLIDTHMMLDYVHPTLKAFHVLAKEAYKSATIRESLETNIPKSSSRSFEESLKSVNFTTKDLATAYLRMEACIRFLGRYQDDPTREFRTAEKFREWATQLESGEIQPGEQGTESFKNDAPPGINLSK